LLIVFGFCIIQFLLQGIGQLIKQKQQPCIMELGKAHAIPFNIFIDARYHCVKVVGAINVLTYFPIWLELKICIFLQTNVFYLGVF
jgi:hypothetical protein